MLQQKKCGFLLPLSTIEKYLRRWGYMTQRQKKLAYEQQPKKVQCWLDEEYPAIAKQAEGKKNTTSSTLPIIIRENNQKHCF